MIRQRASQTQARKRQAKMQHRAQTIDTPTAIMTLLAKREGTVVVAPTPRPRKVPHPEQCDKDNAHTGQPTSTDDHTHTTARKADVRRGRHDNLLPRRGGTGEVGRNPAPLTGEGASATRPTPKGRAHQTPTHAVAPTGAGPDEMTVVATGAEATLPTRERDRLRWL